MAKQIQLRRDTAANWTTANPVLAIGEQGYETDTGKRKIGDGSTAWSSLSYYEASFEPAFSKNTAFNKDFGSASGDVCQGNDSRLSDTRTPTDSSVSPAKLDDEFKTTVALSGTAVDWSTGVRFTKTITANTTLTFSNLHVGTKLLEITGDFAITLPTGFVYAGGTRASSGATLIQVVCTDTLTPKGWYIILKDES